MRPGSAAEPVAHRARAAVAAVTGVLFAVVVAAPIARHEWTAAPAAPRPVASMNACAPGRSGPLSVPDASAPGGRRAVWVHRPPGPDRADLPVLYLLHGYPGDPQSLLDGLAALFDQQMCRTGRPFVVAAPDGEAGDIDTEWGDDAAGRFAIESFVTTTAIDLVEGARRRPAALRAIAGFSMGGYGAAALALRHPDEYRQAACFAGYFHVDDPDGVFGADPDAHAPDRLLDSPAVHGERFFLAEGADDHLPLMSGSIHGEADRMATGLRDRSMTVAVAHPPGGHAASAWYPAIPAAVDFLDTGWRPGPVR